MGQGRLRGAVGQVPAARGPPDGRGDADDRARPAVRAAGEQVRDRRLGQAVRDHDVEPERVLQVPRRGRQERPRQRAAHVVDDDVQPTEGVDRGRGQSRGGAGSLRSAGTTTARRPAASTSRATAASWSPVRAEITTSAPAWARATAVAAPIPG